MARRAATPDPLSPTHPNTRRSARLGSHASSSVSPSVPRSVRGKGRPRKILAQEQLEPVAEDPAAQASVSDDEAQVFQDAPNVPLNLVSPGDHSNLSGATAVSNTYSPTQVNEMRTHLEAVLDRLPDLSDDSSRVLRQLAAGPDPTLAKVADLAAQLQNRKSPASLRLNVSKAGFNDSFNAFSSSSEYVAANLVLRSITESPSTSATSVWRPDDILYKANLAKMVVDIMAARQNTKGIKDTLERLDASFADLLLSSIGPDTMVAGSSKLLELTFDAALALRTQLAVVSSLPLADQDSSDAQVRDVFLHSDMEQLANSQPRMKGFGIAAFEDSLGRLRTDLQVRAHEAYQTVLDLLNSGDTNADDGSPIFWSGFQFHLISWATARASELTSRIAHHGGAEIITSALRERMQKPIAEWTATALRRNVDRQGRAIGKLAKMLTGGSRILKDPLPRNPASDPVTGARDQRLQNDRGAQSMPRGGRSLIDRQPNAQRLSFEDSQPAEAIVVLDGDEEPRRNNATDLDEPVSQDQGFTKSTAGVVGSQRAQRAGQRQTKSMPAANPEPASLRKRGRETETSDNVRAKRARVTADQGDDDYRREEHSPSDEENGNANIRRQRQPPQAVPLRAPSPPSTNYVPVASNYPEANNAARYFTAARKQGFQERTTWSTIETDTLREYIVKYGPRWSLIKQMDQNPATENDEDGNPILRGPDILSIRGQVALKDKARNMKMDYLKAGHQLPRNFDIVTLKASDKEKLRSLGIDPDG